MIHRPYAIEDLIHIRTHFKDDLRGRRFFITGAHSWMGTWITSALDYLNADFQMWMKPYKTFPTGVFDYVIHMAQYSTDRVIEWAHKAQCKTILFTSSGSVDKPDPDAKSNKLADEKLISSSGLDYKIARAYTLIGPGDYTKRYAAANFIKQALRGEAITVKNAGTSIRTYIYMADVAVWMLTTLLHGTRGIYDVAGHEPITMLDLAERILELTGGDRVSFIDEVNTDIRPVYVPDPLHYRNSTMLGLKVWIDIDEAIKRTVEYYR